ncbi:hypothetical protein MHZ92_19995 [Sporosarcina sp. ACRSL]|uniref:hypothetical protein n=1 Tax=Sporosarcina sp. ACRSL TaxID=2918215 RepID=UPI001EF7202C|nr:hypothetical protein [Sporosarcina sp. ACRSL]MCG7346391.1 hypothetical protein [Sporosarcina sp. ACRSL]
MEKIDLTLNIEEDDGGKGFNVTGALTAAGETTDIDRYFGGGNAIFPLYITLRDEIKHVTNCEIVINSNHRRFKREITELDEQTGTLAKNLRREAQNNNLIIRVSDGK